MPRKMVTSSSSILCQPRCAVARLRPWNEIRGRDLFRVKYSPENIRVGERSGRPLKRVHLEIALDDVRIHRGKFIGAHIEVDPHRTKVLLNHRRLQPIEFL